jgi:probable rRNA maturation factor
MLNRSCSNFSAGTEAEAVEFVIDIINLQRKIKVDTARVRRFVKQLAQAVDEAAGRPFAVAFVLDARMIELNSLFRGKDGTTDVLSFPQEPDELAPDENSLGDIVISVDQAQKQAEENGLTLENEIEQLVLHGLLHLCGYDHETDGGEMNEREMALRDELQI